MNDLDMVRAFRADAPVSAPRPLDLTGGESAPNRRLSLVAAAAVVAVATGGVLVLQNGPGSTPSEAAVVLRHAAAVVAAQDEPRPGDKQWLYYSSASTAPGQPFDPDPDLRAYGWTTFDGSQYAEAPSNDVSDVEVDTVAPELVAQNDTPARDYDTANALPAGPEELLDALGDSELTDPEGDTEAARAFDSVVDVLERRLIPSRVQANLFRALATIPGVDVVKDVGADVLGRPAVSVTFDEHDEDYGMRVRTELLLDPTTYAFNGTRTTALEAGRVRPGLSDPDHPETDFVDVEAGEVIDERAIIGPVPVEHPGDVVDPAQGAGDGQPE